MTADPVWPQDADGDVLRHLAQTGFDFNMPHRIEFEIDFDSWPPPAALLQLLHEQYSQVEVIEPDEEDDGYILFAVDAKLTYELVAFVQDTVSGLAAPFGGVCESWGVLHA